MEPEIPVNIITNQYYKHDREQKLGIIQKYMRGYKVYMDIAERRARFVKTKTEDRKGGSSSSGSLERATNQCEVLREMSVNKEEEQNELLEQFNKPQSENLLKEKIEMVPQRKQKRYYEEDRQDVKKLKDNLKDRNTHRKLKDQFSKSVSSFDKDKNDSKTIKNDIISKSLKLLKKKRPFSAKVKDDKEK